MAGKESITLFVVLEKTSVKGSSEKPNRADPFHQTLPESMSIRPSLTTIDYVP
jgi:hypothetical protein